MRQGLAHWKAALDATLHALAVGAQAAPSRPPLTLRADASAQELRAAIENIYAFASAKTNQLYTEAELDQKSMFPRLSAFLGVLVLLCGGIMFHLLESLRTPLRDLTRTAKHFRAEITASAFPSNPKTNSACSARLSTTWPRRCTPS